MHDLKKFRISSSVARNGIPVQGETRVSRLQLSLCLVCVKVRKSKSSRRQHPANPRLGNMSLSSRIPSYIIPLMRIMHVIVGRDQAVQLTSTHKCLTSVTGKEHVTEPGPENKNLILKKTKLILTQKQRSRFFVKKYFLLVRNNCFSLFNALSIDESLSTSA